MNIDLDKVLYLVKKMDVYICGFIRDVLMDSEEDPHYSAVSATNLIKCKIQLMSELGKQLSFSNVKEYMIFNGFTAEEYEQFEISRESESYYYGGKQF